MKKTTIPSDGFTSFSDGDHKQEYLEQEAIRNLESTDKWLYLGADDLNNSFAKIGMTMGNLGSRSYSSGSPSFYLFCAFKFRYNISKQKAKQIEDDVLSRIEERHRDVNGLSTRMCHYESGQLSECFFPVNFFALFKDLHDVIYSHHRDSFVISGYINEFGIDDGEFVDCIFNPRHKKHHNEYIKMILRYD